MHRTSAPPRFSFVFDFDSTLVSVESLDELIALSLRESLDAGKAETAIEKIRRITDAGMNGEIDFRTSVARRLKIAKVNRHHLKTLCKSISESITRGLPEIIEEIRKAGSETYIISGALIDCVIPVALELKIPAANIFANQPVFNSAGRLTGIKPGLLTSTDGKTKCLRHLKKRGTIFGKTVMVGDGVSDLHPYQKGVAEKFLGVGIHRKRETVRRDAPHFFTSVPSLHRHIRSLLQP